MIDRMSEPAEHVPTATPGPLADAMRSFATDLDDIAVNALAGVGNDDPAQAGRLHDGDTVSVQITQQCK
jgi:hypothetical protein